MKTAVRWIRRLLDVALLLLVVSVLGLVLAVNIGPRLGHDLVVIRGGSMEPAIHLGSVTEVSQVRPADLRPGDVVMLKETSGVLVSYRITRVVQLPDGLYIETRGDANASVDPVLVPVSQVMGRVDLAIPGLGYLLFLLTIPAGVLAILGVALAMLFSIWLLEDFERESDGDSDEAPDHTTYESDLARILDAQQKHEPAG
ncbi:MAG: signal peptidase I [Candidatus Limnocylindrales bacterium]|jgi:signal peptidase I